MTLFLIGFATPIILVALLVSLNAARVRREEREWSKMTDVEKIFYRWKENHKEMVWDPRYKSHVARVKAEIEKYS